jgi:hypothetical protein
MKRKLKIALAAFLFTGFFGSFISNVNSQQLIDAGSCSCDASTEAKCVARSGDCTAKGTGAAKVETDFY